MPIIPKSAEKIIATFNNAFDDDAKPDKKFVAVWLKSAFASYAVYLAGKLPELRDETEPVSEIAMQGRVNDFRTGINQGVSDCRAAIMREVEGKE